MEFIKQLDVDLLVFINSVLANHLFDIVAPIVREKTTWIPLYLALAILLFKIHGKKAFLWIGAALLLILISDQTALFTKNYFQRLRPCNEPDLSGVILLKLSHCSSSFSFISAHAANHFAQATLYSLIFKKWYAWVLFYLWASIIGFAQIYVGIHYPTDILVGSIWGIILGVVVYKATLYFYQKFYSYPLSFQKKSKHES
jgi:undecaprenyl-diphosphatase